MNLAFHRGPSKPGPAARWPVVLLIVALLSAVAESACTNGTDALWISSQSDADALSSCGNITTDVKIQSEVLTAITLNGIRRIDGTLEAADCSLLESIGAPDLEWINSEFKLRNLSRLTNVSFPQLETITEGVYWEDLPVLVSPLLKSQGVDNFNNPGTNIYGDLYVKSSGLQSLDDFNFGTFARAGNIRIIDNPGLKQVDLTGLVDANDIEVLNNSPDAILLLSDLASVGSLSVQGISTIDISSLKTMDTDLAMSENSFVQFHAPNLTVIGGDTLVEDNENLISLDMPILQRIGGGYKNGDFKVANNPSLRVLELPVLLNTDGNTTIIGNFDRISLPALDEMSTGFHITTTTADTFNCSFFDYFFYYKSELISTPTRYNCAAFNPKSPEKDVALHYSPPHAHSALPKPALIVIIVICVILFLAVSTFLLRGFYILPMRRRHREAAQAEATEMRRRDIAFAIANRRTGSRSTSEDKLPPYRRIGRAGEVPPGYEGGEAPGYEEATGLELQVPPQVAETGRERDTVGDIEMQEGDRRSRTALRLLLPRLGR